MRCCEQCGAELVGGYRNRRYCNSTCRSRRCRAVKKATAQQQQRQQLRVMLEHMAKIAPRTARSVKSFVDENGFDCGFSAVKLCLAFHQETRMLA